MGGDGHGYSGTAEDDPAGLSRQGGVYGISGGVRPALPLLPQRRTGGRPHAGRAGQRGAAGLFEEAPATKSSASKNVSADSAEEKESVKTWKQNRPSKLKFSYKEQREFETIDDDIAALESKIEKLDADIMANATNSGKLNELTQQKEEAEVQLEEKMDRWVYLNDLAEQIEAQK